MPNPKIGIEVSAKNKTKAAFNDVNRGLSEMQSKLSVVTTAVLGLAGAGGMGALVTMQGQATVEAVRYANALNMSSQELIAWQSAARTAGVEGDKMSDIFKDVSEKIGDAVHGGGEAAEVLERMNLNARDMARLSPDQQMLRIAEGLQQIETQSEKVQILEALGSDLSLMLPLLDDNAEKLRVLRDESIAYGEALSDVDAQNIKDSSDAIDRAGRAVGGVGRTIAAEMSIYVEAIANSFADAAIEHDGFREEIVTGMEHIVDAVGVVADAYQYLEIVFDTVRLGGAQMISSMSSGIAWLDESLSEFIDKVPGLDARPSQSLQTWAQATKLAVDDAAASLDELFNAPKNSEVITEAFEKLRRQAKMGPMLTGGDKKPPALPLGPSPEDEKAVMEEAKLTERLQRRIDALNQTLMSERELELFRFEEKEFLIEEAYQEGLLKQEERNLMLQTMEQQHQDVMTKIMNKGLSDRDKFLVKSTKDKVKHVTSELQALTQGVAVSNKTMFNINKAAAIANAAVKIPAAAINALEAYPPPLSFAMAGAQIAVGIAQLSAIKSSSFDGGGSAPSLAGSGATPVTPVTSTGESVGFGGNTSGTDREEKILSIEDIDADSVHSGSWVRNLIDLIKEEQANGYTLV